MESAKPREHVTAPSTTWPPPNTTDLSATEPAADPNERWNWWILQHGLLIATALIAAALVTVSLRIVSDHRNAQANSAGPTVRPGVTATVRQLPTTAPTTTVASQVLAQTAVAPAVSAAPLLPTPTPSSTAAAPITAATTIATTTTSVRATTTIAATSTTPAPTTTTTATTVPATTPTVAPISAAEAAQQLPHLQLGNLPVTWVQVTRRATSKPESRPTAPAVSFRWVGPQPDTSVLVQIAAAPAVAASAKTQTVRGHEANVIANGSDTSIQWVEAPGVVVGVSVHGFTEDDAVTFANNLVSVSDADWARLIERSKLVNPPSWDRVLLADW